jgi:dTDP-glucose pyrophosphorylase/CBS domain-containing protein
MNYQNLIIRFDATILEALKQMDANKRKLLLVFDNEKFISLLSIGDIQRAIIKNFTLDTTINNILRKEVSIAFEDEDLSDIKNRMIQFRTECMPVVDRNRVLKNVMFWEEVFGSDLKRKESRLNLPVVIMAGGQGTRLKPITNILPKPLIPLGKKTIVEEIIDNFTQAGCNSFYISVNYKAEMIKHYFGSLDHPGYSVEFFQEDQPLGTAGSLYLLKNKIHSTIFVSNCDIIIDQDPEDIYRFHTENKNVLTIVAALKHYKIPYGTITTSDGGMLTSIDEKPELTFQINSGLYILEPEILKQIPENKFYHITDLINDLLKQGKRIGVFPVSEGAWRDIGDWEMYLKNVDKK